MSREATVDAVGLHERASATPTHSHSAHRAEHGSAPGWTEGTLDLRQQQEWFAAIVSTPQQLPAPVDALSAARLVKPSATLSSLDRIEIYRRGYHARLIECLVDDYPVLQHLLGEEEFDALCRRYISVHPSTAPSLNYFGRHMADLCRGSALPEPGFASDLATLEWAIVLAIHASSSESVGMEELARVPVERWPGARFSVNPSLRVLSLDYPANAYLQAFRQGKPAPSREPRATSVSVYRTGRNVWRLELDPTMVTLIESLAAGRTLETALGEVQGLLVGKSEAEAAQLVSHCFQNSIQSGLFSAITV